jgi:hypothetical protein
VRAIAKIIEQLIIAARLHRTENYPLQTHLGLPMLSVNHQLRASSIPKKRPSCNTRTTTSPAYAMCVRALAAPTMAERVVSQLRPLVARDALPACHAALGVLLSARRDIREP